jgi:protein-disulfide isomerase
MIWTILILVLAILLFVFGGMLLKHDAKKPNVGKMICKKSLKVFAVILIAGAVARLVVPYYLINVNPAILQEMATNMQAQVQEEANKGVREYVRDNADAMMADAPILGNADAEKTIFLFSAYSCGYCGRVHSELMRVLEERDDVRVVIKNFSIHGPMSDAPARAMIAAKIQDSAKAAALDKMLFEGYYTQEEVADQSKVAEVVEKNVLKLAEKAGLDIEKLKADMNGEVVARELAQVRDLANRFQISGTPYLIINDQAFPGAIPYEQIIEALN